MPTSFDKLEMNGNIERQANGQMDTKNDLGDLSKKHPTLLAMLLPQIQSNCQPPGYFVTS